MKLTAHKQNFYSSSRSGSSEKGFTLIEVIVVIAIVVSLASIGFGVFSKMHRTSRENETRAIINAVAAAMEARSADISSAQRLEMGLVSGGLYPAGGGGDDSSEELVFYISGDFDGDEEVDDGAESKLPEVVVESAGKNSYIKEVGSKWLIVDSWGTPLRYTYPGVYHNQDDGFDIESAGPDGEFGGGSSDDLAKDNIILK